jgi:hypothetical protein
LLVWQLVAACDIAGHLDLFKPRDMMMRRAACSPASTRVHAAHGGGGYEWTAIVDFHRLVFLNLQLVNYGVSHLKADVGM